MASRAWLPDDDVHEVYTWDAPLLVPFYQGERQLTEYDLRELGIEYDHDISNHRIRFLPDGLVEIGDHAFYNGAWISIVPGQEIEIDNRVIVFSLSNPEPSE